MLTWSDSLPFTGTTFQMDLEQLPLGTFGFMMLGFSDASCWHLWLPAELSSFLMPGCWLYTDIVDAPYVQVVDGKARCPLPIPMVPGYEGLRFFAQGMIYDPTANACGFTTTNAAAAVLGSWVYI